MIDIEQIIYDRTKKLTDEFLLMISGFGTTFRETQAEIERLQKQNARIPVLEAQINTLQFEKLDLQAENADLRRKIAGYRSELGIVGTFGDDDD